MNGENEDQKSFEDLPVEVLEKMFLALDAKSLKYCCLVNKKWNNVIGQSSRIMEKLPLLLDENWISSWSDVYQESKNFEHKFHTIRIKNHNENDEYAIKTLRKFGAECRRIEFYECVEFSMESVKCPHLESVKIRACLFRFSEMMNFFSTQTKLSKLDMGVLVRQFSFECLSGPEHIQIPIKTLSLWIYNDDDDREIVTVAFLKRFIDTLEDFNLINKCDSAFELIFTKFNKLKSLTIRTSSLPKENSFYHKLQPNYSVKKLVVKSTCIEYQQDKEILKSFFRLMPNVEKLEIGYRYFGLPENMLFFSNHLKNLTSLQFEGIFGHFGIDCYDGVRFPNVKTMVFEEVSSRGENYEQWKVIGDAFPNVESLSVDEFSDPRYFSYQSIKINAKNWPNLISLKLGKGFVAHDEIFIELLRNNNNIKKVEFAENAFKSLKSKVKILQHAKEHGIRLVIQPSKIALTSNFQLLY